MRWDVIGVGKFTETRSLLKKRQKKYRQESGRQRIDLKTKFFDVS
jgi:hypothetical protein